MYSFKKQFTTLERIPSPSTSVPSPPDPHPHASPAPSTPTISCHSFLESPPSGPVLHLLRDQLELLIAPLNKRIHYLESVIQNLAVSVGDNIHTLTQNRQGIYNNKLFELEDVLSFD
ncbi:hypothetical protein HMPREF1544_05824 [Mucor circinelloides 1006PhL]|uniref:Uncharacterized protein n=1 Tax=Mucor circinelloides f. circinelloides (strain 1006PhL) TaxID=1220926 RepID=S2JXB5_MUCC1|nr:hypothetical protein HMPREF1544_05824 [Mucor circinelloides 1006PhL]